MKNNIFLLIVVFSFLIIEVNAQIFSGTTGSIPDNNCPTQTLFTTVVSGVGTITDINDFNVSFTSNHAYNGDLDVYLESPSGTIVELTTDNGGFGSIIQGLFFADYATVSITSIGAPSPLKGTFLPEGNLSDFLGENADGTWTLRVCDDGSGDIGSIDFWSVSFRQNNLVGDVCSNPILLPIESGTSCNNPITHDLALFSNSLGQIDCSTIGENSGDIWFKLVIPASGQVIVETSSGGNNNVADTWIEDYTTACSVTSTACLDADGGTGYHETKTYTGAVGDTILLRVGMTNSIQVSNTVGEFAICAYDGLVAPPSYSCPSLAAPATYCYDDDLTDEVIMEICPDSPTDIVSVTINAGSFEAGYDSLRIFSGASGSGLTGAYIFNGWGDLSGTEIGVANVGDCLIFVVGSDGSNSCVDNFETSLSITCRTDCSSMDFGTTQSTACSDETIQIIQDNCISASDSQNISFYYYLGPPQVITIPADAGNASEINGGNPGLNCTFIGTQDDVCVDALPSISFTNETDTAIPVNFFAVVKDLILPGTTSGFVRIRKDCGVLAQHIVSIDPAKFVTVVTDDGTSCGIPSVELRAADGTVIETQTGSACTADGQAFNWDFSNNPKVTVLDNANCTNAPTSISGTINCSNCSAPCDADAGQWNN